MSNVKPHQTLIHPQHGSLPARRILDCVFALQPNGPILHVHVPDVTIRDGAVGVEYVLQDRPPSPDHARCRIIPPFVAAF